MVAAAASSHQGQRLHQETTCWNNTAVRLQQALLYGGRDVKWQSSKLNSVAQFVADLSDVVRRSRVHLAMEVGKW